jgi:hypothetical protein
MPWSLLWIALLATLAVVIVMVLRRQSAGRRPVPKRPPTKPARPGRPGAPTAKTGPQPGEIWWAEVPYEDGSGSKVRPCLVLRSQRGGFAVLKITSQDQSHRGDHVEIPTRPWDPDADHNSFLDLTDPIPVAAAAFENRAGSLDPAMWRKVRTLHKV